MEQRCGSSTVAETVPIKVPWPGHPERPMKWGPNAVPFTLEFNWYKTAVLPVRAGCFRTGRKMRQSLAYRNTPFV